MTEYIRPANRVSDLDLSNWRQYDDILTDSLWILDARDSTGAHQADYHGNFIPQIPNQLLRRFTKAGDIVLDPFVGSGTTAIEASRLGRRYIGVELSPEVAHQAERRISQDQRALFENPGEEVDYAGLSIADHQGAYHYAYPSLACAGPLVDPSIIVSDSSNPSVADEIKMRLNRAEASSVQFLIMHPPYHNIIKFSDDPADLSNCQDVDHFLERFLDVYRNVGDFLESGRHLAIVIGDIYQNSEWVPLQSLLTAKLLEFTNLRLKSIIVKNMVNNRAKRNQEHLWRYRALANGFYIFKHEYIVLFQKMHSRGGGGVNRAESARNNQPQAAVGTSAGPSEFCQATCRGLSWHPRANHKPTADQRACIYRCVYQTSVCRESRGTAARGNLRRGLAGRVEQSRRNRMGGRSRPAGWQDSEGVRESIHQV